MGLTVASTPITKNMFAILDPITFPTAISLWPILAAETVPASSGRLVPTATTLKPITISGTPNALAISTAELTVICAPISKAINPPPKNMKEVLPSSVFEDSELEDLL